MDSTGYTGNAALRNMMGDFISSYAQRDTTVDFSIWLSDRLRQELPDMTQEASTKLTAEIVEAVAGYDRTLQELNAAVAAGQPKEEWLSEQLEAAYQDMPVEEAGKALQRVEAELISSNQLIARIAPATVEDLGPVEAESIEWNKYRVKAVANNIGRQANMLVLSAAVNAMNRKIQDGESGGLSAVITDALQGGLQSDPEEIKAVVSGAMRAATEKGLTNLLPQDTPTEVIGELSGVAVEGARALFDAASGNISATEAMDMTGRASFAAACRLGSGALREFASEADLPGGAILVELFGLLCDLIESPEFIEEAYPAVRNAVITAWNRLIESNIGRGIRNIQTNVAQAFS